MVKSKAVLLMVFSLLVTPVWSDAKTVEVSIGEMRDFLFTEPYGKLSQYIWADYFDDLKSRGVFFVEGGVAFYKNFYGGRHHCGSTKHSWYVNSRAFISNSSDLYLIYDALSEPVSVGVNVDGRIRFDGNATFRPSTSILGKCVRYDKISVNLDMPDLPISASIIAEMHLNPEIIPRGVSLSGRTEIVIDPTGRVKAKVNSYGDPDIDADVDAHGGVGAIVGAIFGAPIAGFLTEIGLAEVGGDYVAEEVEDVIIDYLSDIRSAPIYYDFSSKLGGRQIFYIPNLSTLSGHEVASIISSEGFFMLLPDIRTGYHIDDIEDFLAYLMVFGRTSGNSELGQVNSYSAALYTAITGF